AYGAEVTIEHADYFPNGFSVRYQADKEGRFEAAGIPLRTLGVKVRDEVSGGIALLSDLAPPANGEVLDLGDIVLDDKSPQLAFLDPADGSTVKPLGGPLMIDLGEAAAGLDLSTLLVFYPGGSAQTASDFTIANGRAVGQRAASALAIGSNHLRVTVRDQAGNLGSADTTFAVTGSSLSGHVTAAAGGD